MPGPGQVTDRGLRGIEYKDKRLVMSGASFIEPLDSVAMFEDFVGDALNGDTTIVTQSGTAVTAGAISATAGDPIAGHGGWVAGASDDVDAEIDEVAVFAPSATVAPLRPARAANGLLVCEWRFTVPTALTARQHFVGLSDDPTEGTATNGSLNIQAALTLVSVATDAAGFIFSSLATNPTLWKSASVIADVDGAVTDSLLTQVADTQTVLRVEIDSAGNAYFYGNVASAATASVKHPLSHLASTGLAVTPTVSLVPLFTAAPTAATSVPWEIDYCFAACAR